MYAGCVSGYPGHPLSSTLFELYLVDKKTGESWFQGTLPLQIRDGASLGVDPEVDSPDMSALYVFKTQGREASSAVPSPR